MEQTDLNDQDILPRACHSLRETGRCNELAFRFPNIRAIIYGMPNDTSKVNLPLDSQIKTMIEGYARANTYIEQERMKHLAQMTLQQSSMIYADMIAGWENLPQLEKNLERLDMWRVDTLIRVRKAFFKYAQVNNLV